MSLALKNFSDDIVSGVTLQSVSWFKVGDLVQAHGVKGPGFVQEVGLRATTIKMKITGEAHHGQLNGWSGG